MAVIYERQVEVPLPVKVNEARRKEREREMKEERARGEVSGRLEVEQKLLSLVWRDFCSAFMYNFIFMSLAVKNGHEGECSVDGGG